MTKGTEVLKNYTILIADDDADDRLMASDAFHENFQNTTIKFVEDGEELMDYLTKTYGDFSQKENEKPQLILLDLNMPRKDGREALAEIKRNKNFRKIPVIVFSTSKDANDIKNAYDLGVNCYITKPNSYTELLLLTKKIGDYWFKTVELPMV